MKLLNRKVLTLFACLTIVSLSGSQIQAQNKSGSTRYYSADNSQNNNRQSARSNDSRNNYTEREYALLRENAKLRKQLQLAQQEIDILNGKLSNQNNAKTVRPRQENNTSRNRGQVNQNYPKNVTEQYDQIQADREREIEDRRVEIEKLKRDLDRRRVEQQKQLETLKDLNQQLLDK